MAKKKPTKKTSAKPTEKLGRDSIDWSDGKWPKHAVKELQQIAKYCNAIPTRFRLDAEDEIEFAEDVIADLEALVEKLTKIRNEAESAVQADDDE